MPSTCSVQWWSFQFNKDPSLLLFQTVSSLVVTWTLLSSPSYPVSVINAWLNPVPRSWFTCIGPHFIAEVVCSKQLRDLSILHCNGQQKHNAQTVVSHSSAVLGSRPSMFHNQLHSSSHEEWETPQPFSHANDSIDHQRGHLVNLCCEKHFKFSFSCFNIMFPWSHPFNYHFLELFSWILK